MVGRWMVCALVLAACTGESGGNRMMIDAPVGTGGIGGTAPGIIFLQTFRSTQ